WASIKDANRAVLLLAAVVNLVSLALKAVRWWIFLRPVGVPSLWMALKATFAGAGLNNILVANGGEAARVVFVSRAAHVQSAKIATPAVAGWRARFRSYVKHLMQTIGGISTGPRFIAALALSVGIWALQVWTYSLTARAADFNLPLVGTVAAILAVNLGFAVRATPGNVGVFQAMYAATAAGFGMDKDQAIAVPFLIQTQQIIPVTLL